MIGPTRDEDTSPSVTSAVVWTAALWGLVQGLTEFLPVSSSGHLVLVPALLEVDPPPLAVSAVLHIGTLAAVLWYFRADVGRLARFRRHAGARRLLGLIVLATIPAVIVGLSFESAIDEFNDDPDKVAIALIVTGLILLAAELLRRRQRRLSGAGVGDAVVVGLAQAMALVPGISRSGTTIVAGLGRGLTATEAARFSFLLAIPVIAGSGIKESIDLAGGGGLTASVWVGVAVAAVTGYFAIAFLLRLLRRTGLAGFGVYCLAFGALSLIRL